MTFGLFRFFGSTADTDKPADPMPVRRNFVRRRQFAASLIGALALPAVGHAHDFWLQPTTFNLAPGHATPMMIEVGHGVDRQKSLIGLDRVTRFDALSANGRVDLKSTLRLGDANQDTQLSFAKRGVQVVAFETNGTYSTLPDIRYNDYIKFEGLTPAIVQRQRLKQTTADGKEIYSRRAKALIQVGPYSPADDAVVTKAIGMSLEIVPEVNPYAPGFKGSLPVRIYYNGKPLAGATVMMNNLDFDARPTQIILSDANGRAVLTLPHLGEWQANVVWTRPISNDPKADFETTFSSLTFGFPKGSH